MNKIGMESILTLIKESIVKLEKAQGYADLDPDALELLSIASNYLIKGHAEGAKQ